MKKESASLSEVLPRIFQIIWGRFPQLCFPYKVTSTRTGQLINGPDITNNYHGYGQHSSFVCAEQLHCSVNTTLDRSAKRPEQTVASVSFTTHFGCIYRPSVGISKVDKLVPTELRMLFY